ncbi:hypothetical protein [Streptomyces sp. enrichment culture]|uniref:hypothetical protein n=1 Tax=Streptomyces sp. enrichment culture TaxID=1795815 RepID=UPI003F546087
MGAVGALEKPAPVVPAFGCGVLLARRKVVPADSSKVFADYAFLFAVPCFLFGNIHRSDLAALTAVALLLLPLWTQWVAYAG